MDLKIVNGIPVVQLRAFRAINEPETCKKFLEGHKHVLVNFGIEMITSARDEWLNNPGSFVLVVESLDREHVYGGMRLHFANGLYPLPIETAVGYMDPRIYDIVKNGIPDGVGEGCGLWNSKQIAGYGIGSVFLSIASTALATILGAKTFYTLCAPYTVKMAEEFGMRKVIELGNEGTFYYPKLDLLATVMVYEDLKKITTTNENAKKAITELIENPTKVRVERLRHKDIEIHYHLEIPGIHPGNLQDAIMGKI